MCGLAGYFLRPTFLPPAEALATAKTALAHRGPDDSGLFEDPSHGVGLAHTRLSILDLSPLGHQPMTSDDGRVVLVFNGEIYNFCELRTELEAQGHHLRGHSDTEVLLHLYLAQRQSAEGVTTLLRRLNGIFAFALWDRDLQALLLARDALGVKPLYYSAMETGIAFASEIKALQPMLPAQGHSTSDFTGALDVAALNRYLTFLWCPAEGTPLSTVQKLGPGEAIWVKQGVVQKPFTWYRLPMFQSTTKALQPPSVLLPFSSSLSPLPLTETAAIHGVEQYLRQAVHRQMIADVPVGAFLSGGLDSSSVVAFARQQSPDICCFTIETDGMGDEGFVDDLPYARQVAAHLQVPLEVVRIDSSRMAADLMAMVAQLDEPLADPAPLNVLYISRLARDHGIKILLSGTGGDDLFTGYSRHFALMTEQYWNWLPKSARSSLGWLFHRIDQRQPPLRRLRKFFNGADLGGDARLVNYFCQVERNDLMALYTPEFRAALGDERAEDPMLDFLADLPPQTSRLERLLALEQRFFLTDHNLTYTDKMSMAVGVEVRVPFLDLDLVEFAAHIPSYYKQRGRLSKWVLKKAMEPYLPQNVIYRPKTGFGAPLRRWMRVELRDLLADVLSEQSLHQRGLFEPVAVQRLIQANDRGEIDASYTLLSLLCIELWCRRFIDQVAVASPTF